MRNLRLSLRSRLGRGAAVAAVALGTTVATLGSATPPAHASLLGGLVGGVLGTVGGVVNGVVGILTPGWDDGATTAPTRLSDVTTAIGANQVWARGADGTGIGVALLDSGVAPVDGLTGAGKVVNGPDLSFESQDPAYVHVDTYGHGTHMAGIIAGKNSTGSFKGVAPGAHIVSVKLATHDGATDVTQVIAAIDWVVQHKDDPGMNIRVLNLSFGTSGLQPYEVDPLAYAVEVAWQHGIVVVVAGGNDGTSRASLTNPAIDPYVVSVGADDLQSTTSSGDDTVAPFSSRGSSSRVVDLVAPGVSIASLRDPGSEIDDAHPGAVVDTNYFRGSGTSQAAAVTSGAAALLLSARPSLTPDKVKALLTSTATPLATDRRSQGAGRINVNYATAAAVPLVSKQIFPVATGLGSVESARGTSHVSDGGADLTGEQDIMGSPWVPSVWAPASMAGTAWNGGTWNGRAWAADCWCGVSWSGTSWDSKTWTGADWTGAAWSSKTWTSKTWTSKTWTGSRWTGSTWTSTTWTSKTWTGNSWTSSGPRPV